MNKTCRNLLPLLCFIVAAVTVRTEATTTNISLRIPFEQVRAFFPADGVPFVVWRGENNKWPKNARRGEFFKSEIGEVAFGRAIRARSGDRKNELSLSPGITAHNGYIAVAAGWRAHKEVSLHPDFFDGTISARTFISMQHGETSVTLRDVNFHWNASLVSRVLDFTGTIRSAIESEIANVARRKIGEAIKHEIDTRLADIPNFDVIRTRLSLRIVENALIVIVAD